jgi:hypothetical protein
MLANRGALCGLLVLDLSRLLPGPYCTMILADHGARVIAIEDRRFRNEEIFPATVNRNKEHMTLNLKTVEGREIFNRLSAAADIVVEGFRPEVVKRPLSIENCKPFEIRNLGKYARPYWQNVTFMQGWVAFRTRKECKLSLVSDPHAYDTPGKYRILVKVINIFGNDTSQAFDVEVPLP